MSIAVKLTAKMVGHEVFGGDEIVTAAVAIPPGATLFGGYARGDGGHTAQNPVAGPIGSAIASKTSGPTEGLAGRMPRQQGVLVQTSQRLTFVKVSKFSTKPKELLAEWSADEITSVELGNGASYPYIHIEFSDGTVTRVYSEKKGGLAELVAKTGPWLG